ncbi:hypothetical protein [Phycisphaera mikurensis]|uniref:Glycosyltransferase n=1 Tax=Phycisphaera mikurensis (strain NBRC 102666 / KCTC 22515 / FYK2301M01) TaxID=1142394 RepID=I0IC05_PHYMF|nr:hypothetical protein [Phycisphaera mikurensis]MBB6441983.1 hypothetical protein [Phycisphaera mikurensis]BAM02793.1 hypothetical protein PSMK_06340 [Phycisphaera mikurensis NBRC 102666]
MRHLLRCLRQDPLEIAWEASREEMGPTYRASRPGIFGPAPRQAVGVRGRLRLLGKRGSRAWRRPALLPEAAPVVLVASTGNQHAALRAIDARLADTPRLLLTPDDADRSRGWRHPVPFLLAPLALPGVAAAGRRAGAYGRRSFGWAADAYLHLPGWAWMLGRWMRRGGVRAVVIANDHSHSTRAWQAAAALAGVPCVYAQHATVMACSPPLAFDAALLDGVDTLERYRAAAARTPPPSFWPAGKRTEAFLAGPARFDALPRAGAGQRPAALGVCTNMLDPFASVERLLAAMRTRWPGRTLRLRPHPRTQGDALAAQHELAERLGLGFSDATAEPAAVFLAGVGGLVAGDSGVLLEAAATGRRVCSFDFGGTTDMYGFIAGGLCPRFTEPAGVVAHLGEDADDDADASLVRRHVATAGTPWAGRSAELAAGVVRAVAAREPPAAVWEEDAGLGDARHRVWRLRAAGAEAAR